MAKSINLIGQHFNRLTIIDYAGRNNKNCCVWLCLCDCGNRKKVVGYDLRRGHTKSCGCLNKERVKKAATSHGATADNRRDPEYAVWNNMIQRCENPKNNQYKNYGARGIKVCDQWRNDYSAFIKDIGKRPSNNHSIERIDVDGDYEPSNCKWVTPKEQARNRRIKNTTGVNGVTKKDDRFIVKMKVNGKTIYLGTVSTINEARALRKKGEEIYWEK